MHHFLIIQNNSVIVRDKRQELGRENLNEKLTTSKNNREFGITRCSDDAVK